MISDTHTGHTGHAGAQGHTGTRITQTYCTGTGRSLSGYLTIRIPKYPKTFSRYLDLPGQSTPAICVSTRWQNGHYPVNNPDGAGANRIHSLQFSTPGTLFSTTIVARLLEDPVDPLVHHNHFHQGHFHIYLRQLIPPRCHSGAHRVVSHSVTIGHRWTAGHSGGLEDTRSNTLSESQSRQKVQVKSLHKQQTTY